MTAEIQNNILLQEMKHAASLAASSDLLSVKAFLVAWLEIAPWHGDNFQQTS